MKIRVKKLNGTDKIKGIKVGDVFQVAKIDDLLYLGYKKGFDGHGGNGLKPTNEYWYFRINDVEVIYEVGDKVEYRYRIFKVVGVIDENLDLRHDTMILGYNPLCESVKPHEPKPIETYTNSELEVRKNQIINANPKEFELWKKYGDRIIIKSKCIKISDVFYQCDIETVEETKKLKEMSVSEISGLIVKGVREMGLEIKTYKSKLPQYIGIKNNEITLVWQDYTKTKARLSDNDKYDFLLGFYVAYYKHLGKDRNDIIKLFETYRNAQVKMYLETVFIENCGLDFDTAQRFIRFIDHRKELNTIIIPDGFKYASK